jgi:putative ATPase
MDDLFDHAADMERLLEAPLAERMRPATLDDYIGQEHVVGEGRFLRKIVEQGSPASLILWGPPGTGKTTLARIIAKGANASFESFSAVLSGVKDLREVIARAKERRKYKSGKTILFVDEIHRWNKAQQDAFLPHVESGQITLIGATTQNPSFEVISPLLSRCRVIVLNSLKNEEIEKIIMRAVKDPKRGLFSKDEPIEIDNESISYLAKIAEGDARRALNGLELSYAFARSQGAEIITLEIAQEAMTSASLSYDRAGEEHYNQISAFIKSLRGSDPDAAIYWMVRMLESGEDPLFILRRMVIFAAEDIGNADPKAVSIAVSAMHAFSFIGLPEGKIPMAQAVTYLATCPKSNAAYMALNNATAKIRETGSLGVPIHLRNAPTQLMKELDYGKEYKYPHNYAGNYVAEQYLPDELKGEIFYQPTSNGDEKIIASRLKSLRSRSEEFVTNPPKPLAYKMAPSEKYVKKKKKKK